MSSTSPSRRELLTLAALSGGAALLGRPAGAQQQRRPYGPFRMGIQSYSLRGFKADEAMAHTKALGIRYWEAYQAHVPITTDPAQVAASLDKLKASDIRLWAHGVSRFTADDAANRKIFEGAKALGIQVLSADPDPQSFASLEKLVDEFKIKIAIHNHGPGHRYDKLQHVVDAVKDRHPLIGACVDTGHFLRSKENPVKVVETLGPRVFGVHLKDVKDAVKFTILGKGDLDVLGLFKVLRDLRFRDVMALEYEENPQNPISDITECFAAARSAIEKL